jgi:hypothetical protein
MGKISVVFLLGLLVVVLALSSLLVRRERFEDMPMGADSGSTMLGPDVPNPSMPSASQPASGMLGPGVPNPSMQPMPSSSAPALPTNECSEVANEKGQRATLLRDIRQVVHNELASFKGMTTASSQPLFQMASAEKALLSEDPSIQQGNEMKAARPTYCPKDMSQYIRKDQIPCWGCTLDY